VHKFLNLQLQLLLLVILRVEEMIQVFQDQIFKHLLLEVVVEEVLEDMQFQDLFVDTAEEMEDQAVEEEQVVLNKVQ
jgi:hypothetical protein